MNLRRFRGRGEKDAELTEEIRSHLAHDEDLWTARGVAAEEARRQARVKFGPQNTVHEEEWRYRPAIILSPVICSSCARARSPSGQQGDGEHSQAENASSDPGNLDVGKPFPV